MKTGEKGFKPLSFTTHRLAITFVSMLYIESNTLLYSSNSHCVSYYIASSFFLGLY